MDTTQPLLINPTSGASGLLSMPWHMLGRALGANNLNGGTYQKDSSTGVVTYTPAVSAHPTLDAIFNSGQAQNAALNENLAQGRGDMSQYYDRQMDAQKQGDTVATANNQVNLDPNSLQQTPGQEQFVNDVGPAQATVAGQKLGVQSNYLSAPQAQADYNTQQHDLAQAPKYANAERLKTTAPFGGTSYTFDQNMNPTTVMGYGPAKSTIVRNSTAFGGMNPITMQPVMNKSTEQEVSGPSAVGGVTTQTPSTGIDLSPDDIKALGGGEEPTATKQYQNAVGPAPQASASVGQPVRQLVPTVPQLPVSTAGELFHNARQPLGLVNPVVDYYTKILQQLQNSDMYKAATQ